MNQVVVIENMVWMTNYAKTFHIHDFIYLSHCPCCKNSSYVCVCVCVCVCIYIYIIYISTTAGRNPLEEME